MMMIIKIFVHWSRVVTCVAWRTSDNNAVKHAEMLINLLFCKYMNNIYNLLFIIAIIIYSKHIVLFLYVVYVKYILPHHNRWYL